MSTNLAKITRINPLMERGLLTLAAGVGVFLLIRAGLTLIEPSRAYISPLNSTLPTKAAAPINTNPLASFNPDFDPFHRLIDEEFSITPEIVIGEDAPETDLNITLKGRRASGNGSGSAVLRLPDGKESNFKQGETIFKDVTLEAIYPTHIIISRKGTQERVTFERKSGLLTESGRAQAPVKTAAKSSKSSPPSRAPQQQVNNSIPISPADAIKDGSFANRLAQNAPRGNTKRFTTADAAGARGLLSAVQPSPVRRDGRFIGYRLRGASGSAELSQFGLQSSDVITHIDGQNLPQRPAELSALFERLSKNLTASTLTVDRDGQVLVLSVN